MPIIESTIAAIATPHGFGGVGIIRLSGSGALSIARSLIQKTDITPRYAHFNSFYDEDGMVIDYGLVIYFPSPHSFTGEDVVELQAHGSPIGLAQLLQRLYQLGAQPAGAGAFSERAFLNGKISLEQAEGLMDFIHASSVRSSQAAANTLSGAFSQQVDQIVTSIHALRVWVEAAIDFPEEEIDFLADSALLGKWQQCWDAVQSIQTVAHSGKCLTEGVRSVIIGAPNVGKSSLLNHLSTEQTAITSDIAGTTRDIVRTTVQINGVPLLFSDTAGLRSTNDRVEQEGIKRALEEVKKADLVLLVADATNPQWGFEFEGTAQIIRILNKIDCVDGATLESINSDAIAVSAKTGEGIDYMKAQILSQIGFVESEGHFSVRARHLSVIEAAQAHLQNAYQALESKEGEILAEELRLSEQALSEISGKISSDQLLGDIFAGFCIGK